MELPVLVLFCVALLGCILLKQSVLIALIIGFVLFFSYGLVKGHALNEMLIMSWSGVLKVKNILLTLLLIGMLTAVWRGAGTIAVIIGYSSWFIRGEVFLLASFWLNCLVSFLTGTSFGTAATMGVICMTMGQTMMLNPLFVGGSIMSGIFFGDRCSPVSTSALLVSEVTGTDIYDNIKKMFRSAFVPFILTSVFYFIIGFIGRHQYTELNIREMFRGVFKLHLIALLPALLVVILCVFRVKVKTVMIFSILAAVIICWWTQGLAISEIGKMLIWGYQSPAVEVGKLLNGGGVLSMIRVSAIVCLSSSYAGMFEGTHMLDSIRNRIAGMGKRTSAFGGVLGVSIMTSLITCNQTLAIILTNQLCEKLEPDREKRALDLEDAPVVIAPLIPWSIAGAVPIATIGAPQLCLLAACYLYLIPIWHLIRE